jgi:hypothetical protein
MLPNRIFMAKYYECWQDGASIWKLIELSYEATAGSHLGSAPEASKAVIRKALNHSAVKLNAFFHY